MVQFYMLRNTNSTEVLVPHHGKCQDINLGHTFSLRIPVHVFEEDRIILQLRVPRR